MDAAQRNQANQPDERQPSRRARLFGALRLVFDEADATELVAQAREPLAFDALRRLMRAARSRYRARAGGSFRRAATAEDDDRPLPPSRALPATGALALALHAGDRRDLTEIADLLDRSVDDIALAIDHARRCVDPALPAQCGAHPELISRFHDQGLETEERIALFTHLRSCDACSRYVEAARLLDGELAAEATRLAREPESASGGPRGRLGVVARVAAGVAAIAVLLLALLGLRALLIDEGEPVPALVSGAPPAATGWLLRSDGDLISAYDLATGEQRAITPPSRTPSLGQLLSPDGTRLASVYWSYTPGSVYTFAVTRVADGATREIEWDSSDEIRYPSGWLNEREVVLLAYPSMQPGETQIEYQTRALRDSRILAVDADSWAERVLLEGVPGYVFPSPDGTRVLVLRASGSNEPVAGVTVELRPVVDGQLADPLVTISERMTPSGGYRWAPDGSAVVFLQLDAEPPAIGPDWRGDQTAVDVLPATLVALTRDGTVEPIVARPAGMGLSVAGVGPSARQIAWETWPLADSGSGRVEGGTLSLLDRASGTTSTLSTWEDGWSLGHNVVWSPDGAQYAAIVQQPAYLPLADEDPFGEATLRALTVWTDGRPAMVGASFSSAPGGILAWLPLDALPARAGEYFSDPAIGGFEPVVGVRPDRQSIERASRVSPDGRSLTLIEHDPAIPVVFRTEGEAVRRLSTRVSDVSWLNDSNSLIGVYASDPDDAPGRRMMVYTLMDGIPTEAFDYRVLDPAGLGDTPGTGYATPLVAPDGLHASFFVRDSGARSVALWLAGEELAPREVLRWSRPADALVDPPLVARWLSPTTLLVVEPIDWQRGLPRAARLVRVTLTAGAVTVEPLRTVDGRGDDRGLTIEELVPSPDGEELAWRLRHYRELAADRGRSDSLHVASMRDISQETELTRDRPGYGMTWLDEGRWLVAGLDGRLIAVDVDRLETRWLTPEGDDARWPLRVGDDLWASLDSGDGARIVRATVSAP